MNTLQINEELKSVANFLGTYPKDLLPTKIIRPSFLIVNTQNSDKPGEHWIAIGLFNNGQGEYFDSFGLPPLHNTIVKFMFQNCPKGFIYSNVTIQGVNSITCGLYCIAFIKARNAGQSYCNFISIFGPNKHVNDFCIADTLLAKYKRKQRFAESSVSHG